MSRFSRVVTLKTINDAFKQAQKAYISLVDISWTMYLVVMYPSLFFGEPSRAELFTQRAEPSSMVSKTEPKQAYFFPSSVRAMILNFTISIGIIRSNNSNKFLHRWVYHMCHETHHEKVPVIVFKLIMTRTLYSYSKLTQTHLLSHQVPKRH